MAIARAQARPDLGKLIMVPTAAVLLVCDVVTLGSGGAGGPLRWLGGVLLCAFYLLVIGCYLRRGPAAATSDSLTAHVAAVTATLAPFAIPLVRGAAPGPGQQGLADVLLVAGQVWALWSLRFLGRNLSVLAQAREVVDRGPYKWVRHPLYTGEITAGLGLALAANSGPAMAVWLGICGLQAYRELREEQVLLRALPGYRDYRARTAALLPGVF